MRDLRGPRETLCWERRVILIDPGEGAVQRRCSLAHAVAHLDLGHRGCRPDLRHEQREEREADKTAARRLIRLVDLADAYRWTDSPIEACDELNVDLDMLRVRGANLTTAEQEQLWLVRAAKGGTA